MSSHDDEAVDNRNHTSKIHENSKFKKPYSRVVPKYEKKIREELQKELGLNVPINLFKRDLIADDVKKQIVTKPNKLNLSNVVMKDNSGATATSPIVVEDDSDDDDDGDRDGSPEIYNNLQSNSHINPFKYLNISSSDRAREAATQRTLKSLIQPFNGSRNFDTKTLVKHSNNNTCIKPCLKRRRASDDNQSEYGFINFKKSKPIVDEFRQQIPKFSQCKDTFKHIMGGNQGVIATPPNKNKARRARSRIGTPYCVPF